MIFISYYTKKTPYEKVMNTHLLPSLKSRNLSYDIEAIEDLGSWSANTSYKPTHILKMLKKHKKDVVFLDSDAIIVKAPRLFFEIPKNYDMAIHWLDWSLQWRGKPGDKRELLSGTMMMRYNDKIIALLEKYIEECKIKPNVWEQKILQNILENRTDIKIYNLPPEYVTIIKHNNALPRHIKKPVIIHYQKSREYKR